MFPVVSVGSQGLNPGNDSRHNKVGGNQGGSPSTRTRKSIPNNQRGGHGQQGQRRTQGSMSGRPKPTAGNPASRGGTPGSMHPHRNNPNKGGGVQVRPGRDMQRQFGNPGQAGLPSAATNPKPGRGNLGGRMAKRVAGHFNQKSKFGSAPVSEDV